ncbi:hypothetical protein CHUAL_004379 [Chamberlinius hualienensis]
MATTSSGASASVENAAPTKNKAMRELLFKILIIGDFGVGKTAIIRRYTEGQFSTAYKLTIGVDFAVKSLVWDDRTVVNLQLWDIAGHERFGYMTSVYYKYAIAAIIVYDLSRPATFQSVTKWHKDVQDKVCLQDGRPIPVIIIANKCDIPTVNIERRVLDKFCQQNDVLKWFYTSAKEDININEAIHYLVSKIIQIKSGLDALDSSSGEADPSTCRHSNGVVNLTDNIKSKSKCCGSGGGGG